MQPLIVLVSHLLCRKNKVSDVACGTSHYRSAILSTSLAIHDLCAARLFLEGWINSARRVHAINRRHTDPDRVEPHVNTKSLDDFSGTPELIHGGVFIFCVVVLFVFWL